jgi:hypothetical protein
MSVYPVILLRDKKGIYGIGLNPEFPFNDAPRVRSLIYRPDMITGSEGPERYSKTNAVLQMIRQRLFPNSLEHQLVGVIAEFIMRRAGIECPKEATKEERNAHSKKHHGTVRIAGKIMNRMIFRAIEEAADPIALRAARQFHPDFREVIYRSVVNNPRLLQLVDTFPLLAFNICLPPENWAEHCREEKWPIRWKQSNSSIREPV